MQSHSVEEDQTGKDGKNKSDCFAMKSIRAKLSRPKIPKIFRKSKGESPVAESESKESQKVDKKSKLKVISAEKKEEVVIPSLSTESEVEIIEELEQSSKLSSAKVQPSLAPSETTGRVNLS